MKQYYSLYDNMTEIYKMPFAAGSDEEVIEVLKGMINNKDSNAPELKNNPEDYELYKLGNFDERTGFFDQAERKKLLNCISLRRKEKENEKSICDNVQ